MTIHDQILPTEALAAGEPSRTLSDWITCVGPRIVMWAETSADYHAAAVMYEQLSALSDAELICRDLSRATLARHVFAACDRVSNPAMASKARPRSLAEKEAGSQSVERTLPRVLLHSFRGEVQSMAREKAAYYQTLLDIMTKEELDELVGDILPDPNMVNVHRHPRAAGKL